MRFCATWLPHGLIPARAGNTDHTLVTAYSLRAHPRSRGEHPLNRDMVYVLPGSSPLARGTPGWAHARRYRRGLIPARAGNTVCHWVVPYLVRAHPRSRGEHIDLPPGQYTARGSSPLARGTHPGGSARRRILGLIPARAGNTLWGTGQSVTTWAHPRSRGEHQLRHNT